jgi:GNAT superfamily N-acetyltransferase
VVDSDYAVCIIYEKNGKILGSVCGAKSVAGLYREFLSKLLLRANPLLLLRILNPKFVRKSLETLLYPAKKENNLPRAELLSIFVEEKYQGKKVSQELFHKLVEEFRNMGISQFKAVAGINLIKACRFYEKMGGTFHSEIEVHQGDKSRVYVWKI